MFNKIAKVVEKRMWLQAIILVYLWMILLGVGDAPFRLAFMMLR